MSFTRRKEDFTCEQCGASVHGHGYTNHCPACLWSKHVDVDPGDRNERCGGAMEPIALEGTTPKYRIVHRCKICGAVRRVSVDAADDTNAIVALSAKHDIMGA